jgi:hypothetical protein
MDEALLDKCRDRRIRSVLQRAVTPLIISAVFQAMWLDAGGDTGHTGVEQPELTLHETNADYNDEDGMTINGRKTEEAIRRLAQRWSHTTGYDFGVQDEDSSSELARRESHTTLGNSAMQDEDSSSDQVEHNCLEIEHIIAPRSHMILNKLKDKHHIAKAVKADDAKVPVELWDKAVCRHPPTVEQQRVLLILRGFMLQLYCLQLWQDTRTFLKREHEDNWLRKIHAKGSGAAKDAKAMRDILWRASENDWFEYPAGSRLIFFRFPALYCTQAKQGVKVMFTCKGPSAK